MKPFATRIGSLISAMVIAQTDRSKKPSRGKRKKIYSKSEKNVIIDSLIHPLADQHWSFVLVDGVLHALNEEDPIESFVKFLRYNAPELLRKMLKEIR